jgi:hypothetical protein
MCSKSHDRVKKSRQFGKYSAVERGKEIRKCHCLELLQNLWKFFAGQYVQAVRYWGPYQYQMNGKYNHQQFPINLNTAYMFQGVVGPAFGHHWST